MKHFNISQFLSHQGNDCFPSELTAADGSTVRLCPLWRTKGIPVYCSRNAFFFSYVNATLRRIKPSRYAPDTAYCSGGRKNYLSIRRKPCCAPCHTLVALTWIGPRRKGYQCHHLNGITTDNRADNLIWLSRSRHKRYDARQKQLQELLGDLRIYNREDFERWHAMPEKEFQTMLAKYAKGDPNDRMEYEMTHHMEC